MIDINARLKEYKTYFEENLTKYFEKLEAKGVKQPIFDAIKYSVQNGGKRIRPALVFMGAEFMGHDKSEVIDLAFAIEFIHSYSLVHDDLPSMDNDTLRRGVPTTHVKFGEGMAVLTGDALLNLAFETALGKENIGINDVKAIKFMADNAGIFGMVGGQCIDIRDNSKKDMSFDDLMELYVLKTSKLIEAALMLGAISCGANDDEIKALSVYARNVGIIFQIVDDILDVTSTVEELGKNIGSDMEHGKSTSLDFMTLSEANDYIGMLSEEIHGVMSVFGERSKALIELNDMLLTRRK